MAAYSTRSLDSRSSLDHLDRKASRSLPLTFRLQLGFKPKTSVLRRAAPSDTDAACHERVKDISQGLRDAGLPSYTVDELSRISQSFLQKFKEQRSSLLCTPEDDSTNSCFPAYWIVFSAEECSDLGPWNGDYKTIGVCSPIFDESEVLDNYPNINNGIDVIYGIAKERSFPLFENYLTFTNVFLPHRHVMINPSNPLLPELNNIVQLLRSELIVDVDGLVEPPRGAVVPVYDHPARLATKWVSFALSILKIAARKAADHDKLRKAVVEIFDKHRDKQIPIFYQFWEFLLENVPPEWDEQLDLIFWGDRWINYGQKFQPTPLDEETLAAIQKKFLLSP